MPNSTHILGFRRLFDAVAVNVIEPLKERLRQTWRPGEEEPDAARVLAHDVYHLSAALDVARNGITFRQFAFLGDLFDHAAQSYHLNLSVDEHKSRILELAKSPIYREPPTSTLNLLRGYDAIEKTNVARMYKDLLVKIVTVTFNNVEKPGSRDAQITADFDALWTEVITASRVPEKCFHPENCALAADLNKAVLEFAVPARDVIKTIDQLKQMDSLRDTEGFIRRTFTNYCAQAVLVDSVVDPREIEFFHDLAPTLMFFGQQGSVENLKEIFKGAEKNIGPNEVPMLVSILDVYDNSMNTELGDRARSLYFRLANSAFKSDQTVDEEEMAWLEQFKNTLYPHGTKENFDQAPNSNINKQAGATPVLGYASVDETVAELNALVGLDSVKQDLAQLLNFIKVQQMREAKGLPGSAITKHFIFSGNPGTGKTSVAKILANIYRALGIIDKGHVVEVDRADLIAGSGTSAKIKEVIDSALGGVLFIEEPYELAQDAHGKEAINTLVKAIEDNEKLVVIAAGSTEKLDRFLNANSAFKSLFSKTFHFEDYSPDQMLKIYELFCGRAAFITSPSALQLVQGMFEKIYSQRGEGYANTRDVRRVFHSIIGNQANRIIGLPHVNEEILSTINDEDVHPTIAAFEKTDNKVALQKAGLGFIRPSED